MRFVDRIDAGRRLAAALQHLRGQDLVVCGLPRGGVPVAYEVAAELQAPLDVIVVRKLRVPAQPELAMGAVGESGARFVDEPLVNRAGVNAAGLAELERRERAEIDSTALRFRAGRDPVRRAGRTVVIVDDGIATGSTVRAACQVVRWEQASRVVLAVPVAPHDWTARLGRVADEYVCVLTPEPMMAVGHWYQDFSATPDEEVVACLQRASRQRAGPQAAGGSDSLDFA